jgi:hypothetical protein
MGFHPMTAASQRRTGGEASTGAGRHGAYGPRVRWRRLWVGASSGARCQIKNRAAYEEPHDLAGWRIACNFVGKGHRRGRRHGARETLDLIARLGGGRRWRGYPEAAGAVPAGFLFHAPSALRLGFVRDRKIGSTMVVTGFVGQRPNDLETLLVLRPARGVLGSVGHGQTQWLHRRDHRVRDQRCLPEVIFANSRGGRS